MIDIVLSDEKNFKNLQKTKKMQQLDVSKAVEEILANVKNRGDAAVDEYSKKFDKICVENKKVTKLEIQKACNSVSAEYLSMLRKAAKNIETFHKKQVRTGFVVADEPGIVMGQKITPLSCVGVYVPGGTAAYPSTVLMDVIPAQIAGVEKIIMVTPPNKQGEVDSNILAAANVLGVTEIYKVGGAQAIAALALGTETIPKVDKIVGPGNIYVATAKKLVYGVVDIDMIAGPSDILIIADDDANPCFVAADMLGQAEHDENATAIAITQSEKFAKEIKKELENQITKLPRKTIAQNSLKNNGQIIVTKDMQTALEIANLIAPEHLELCVKEPFEFLPQVKNAGSIFLGYNTPEALGDYYAGPNHTLPTSGTSRFFSPLSVDDFIKKSSYLYYSKQALCNAAQDVVMFAESEGFQAHANSVSLRINKMEK